MEIDTIISGIEKLEKASLYRTPKKASELAGPWFEQFQYMPEAQFLSAIDEIIKLETTFPAIAVVHRYASNWSDDEKRERCPYCNDAGIVLIKSDVKNVAYACRCQVGRLRQLNLKIASYESLGIPWPVLGEKPRRSDKMTADNFTRIRGFLEKVGREIETQ